MLFVEYQPSEHRKPSRTDAIGRLFLESVVGAVQNVKNRQRVGRLSVLKFWKLMLIDLPTYAYLNFKIYWYSNFNLCYGASFSESLSPSLPFLAPDPEQSPAPPPPHPQSHSREICDTTTSPTIDLLSLFQFLIAKVWIHNPKMKNWNCNCNSWMRTHA